MENFPKPAQPTAEELERIEEERKASDRDLIDGGVRHIINDHGRVELRPTEEQIEAARKEMKTDMLVKEIVAMRKKEIEKTPEKKEEDAESGNMTAIKEYHEKWLKEGNSSAENKEKKTQTEKPLGENKEPNKEISNKTLEKANFLNLKKEDLRKIDSFNGLSEAQQILVLEGLNQLAVEESKAKAFSKQQEEMKQAGLFGRFVKGFTKESKLIKLEREAFNEATTGGIKAHGELIKALSEIAEKGPEVELEKDGGVKIKYLGESVFGKDGLNGPEKRQLNYFNDIANRLSLIPEEHSFKTAGKKERKEYDKMFGEYEEAKKKMMETLEKNGLDEKTIFQKMNEVENNIKLNQFLNANPDIEKYIEGVKGRGRLSRELLTKVGGKVFYGGVGYVSRVVPIAAFGAVGAPLGAAAFGGYMAGLRARKELINREKASRKGVEDAKAGAKNFVKVEDSPNEFGIATGLIGKLKKLLEEEDQIKNSEMQESEKEIALKKLNERLAARISYTQEKIDAGLVNYGKGGDAMLNRFNLIESLSGAIVKSEMAGFSGNNLEDIKKLTRKRGDFEYGNKIFRKGELSFQEKAHMEMMGIPYREISEEQEKARGEARKNLSLEDRMRSFLDFRGEAISARQKDYIYKKALKGAAISAGFAFGGYAIRHFAGEWFGWDKGGAGVIKGETQTGVDLKPPSTSYDAELITEKTDIGAEGIEKYSPDPRMAFEEMEEKPRIGAEDYAKIKNYFTTDETERFIFRVNNFQDEGKIIANIIESGNDEYISKILNPDNYEFLEGLHYARDFGGEKGFNLILRKMEDGSVKFGIDGPGALGRYNWGEGGKSWLFKANADFTESNLREALNFIKKAADSFVKGTEDYSNFKGASDYSREGMSG